ncbi:NADH-dependent flavin oxidoreductase [Desulfosediminicola ganghwensis]|uniref:oxidoreductase n=1 Tax=Desulfosediminicola ganghwensis TaxID=2569540 RepID=UPI0010AD255D|nr:NADH-dependent flavin oxidoreductase [Desulfosediminicola ganghwensis]
MGETTNKLFSPFSLNSFTIRNRIGVAPMTRMSGDNRSIPRQDVLDFLVRRAVNGAGIVYTEAIVTDYESAQGYPGQARITNREQIDVWKSVADKIRDAGAISIMQIFHCGRIAWPDVNPACRIIAPSAITPKTENPLTNAPYPLPEEMSEFEIEHVIQGFQETARGAMAAGFDGVEIHGAHGYLISQFLSNYSNKRTDKYGGSLENRFRFAHEIIQSVRKVIPTTKILSFRLSNWGIVDMDVSLFQNSGEWLDLISMLSEQSIDALSISTYDFKENAFETNATMAELTKKASNLPLLICGKVFDRATAETALQHADVALFAKSMLLNPNLVEDLRSNAQLPCYSSEQANVAYTEAILP